MSALASQSNPALHVRAGTARAAPMTSHFAAGGASGTGSKSADVISPLPPPPPSALRPSKRTLVAPNKTSDQRLLLDLTGDDDDVFVATCPTAPATPRKTPKRRAERESDDDDVRVVSEAAAAQNRINETPTKRARPSFLQRAVTTTNSMNPRPPAAAVYAIDIGGDSSSRLQGTGPSTPSRIARRQTQLGQRPSTPSSSRTQPATPASGGARISLHGASSVASQAFYSPPVSPFGLTSRKRDGGSPSPLSRGRHRKSPIYIQDSDSDSDDDNDMGHSHDNPIDVDALYERALANWYHDAQDARAEAEGGDGTGPGNANAHAADANANGLDDGNRNGARQPIGPENFIIRRQQPVSLAEIWTLPLNERGEPPFPASGPDCRFCRRPTAFRKVSDKNPNGNALRPYYVCLACDAFSTWADRKGISAGNAPCHCGEPSRQDRVGEDPRGEKILRPGTIFWTCWQKRCGFFAHG